MDSQPKSSGLVLGRRSLEPGELSQWLCHDDSTINITLSWILLLYYIIIIIIIFFIPLVVKIPGVKKKLKTDVSNMEWSEVGVVVQDKRL